MWDQLTHYCIQEKKTLSDAVVEYLLESHGSGELGGVVDGGEVFVGPGEVFRERLGEINDIDTTTPTGFDLPCFAALKRPYVMQIVLPFVESSGFRSRWASGGTQRSSVASFLFFDAFVVESGYEWKRELILK
jgi:hypothetical protein